MWSWAMLMPSRSRRSLEAHFSCLIDGPEVGDDGTVRVVRTLAAVGPPGVVVIISYHVNNLTGVNHRVNLNG